MYSESTNLFWFDSPLLKAQPRVDKSHYVLLLNIISNNQDPGIRILLVIFDEVLDRQEERSSPADLTHTIEMSVVDMTLSISYSLLLSHVPLKISVCLSAVTASCMIILPGGGNDCILSRITLLALMKPRWMVIMGYKWRHLPTNNNSNYHLDSIFQPKTFSLYTFLIPFLQRRWCERRNLWKPKSDSRVPLSSFLSPGFCPGTEGKIWKIWIRNWRVGNRGGFLCRIKN